MHQIALFFLFFPRKHAPYPLTLFSCCYEHQYIQAIFTLNLIKIQFKMHQIAQFFPKFSQANIPRTPTNA